MRPLFALAALVCAALALGVSPRAGAVTQCGQISVSSRAYSVRIFAGRVSCATAKRVLGYFLTKSAQPRGWFCARGHASQHQAWAAACRTAAGADVRAYRGVR